MDETLHVHVPPESEFENAPLIVVIISRFYVRQV